MSSFLVGVRTSNLWTLLASVIIALTTLIALELYLDEDGFWNLPEGWILSKSGDDWTHVSYQIQKLARTNSSSSRNILYFGGSSARESISSNQQISQTIANVLGTPFQFTNLGSSNQTIAESLLLVDQLDSTQKGLVIFTLYPMFFQDGPDDWKIAQTGIRFPFYSETLKNTLSELGLSFPSPSAINIVRHRPLFNNWLKTRRNRGGYFQKLNYRWHLYDKKRAMSSDALNERLQRIEKEQVPNYETHKSSNVSLLKQAIRTAKKKGYIVALVNLPRHPKGDATIFADLVDDYNLTINQISSSEQTVFWDIQSELTVGSDEFYDHIHFLPPIRDRYEEKLVEHIVSALN